MGYCYIGSSALQKIEPSTTVNDIDIIADYTTAVSILTNRGYRDIRPMNKGKTLVGFRQGFKVLEISLAWPDTTNAEILDILASDSYAPLDMLYLLKMSHRYKKNCPHFLKTRKDILKMRALGAKIRPEWEGLYRRRMKETYNYGHPVLAQGKEGFFNGDGVKYQYDHDSIHEAVAFGPRPKYTLYQMDGQEVLCDKSKWDELNWIDKCLAVAEEAAVLALERSLIPFPGKKTCQEAYLMALEKVCTSITSGWFREFAWENYDAIAGIKDTYNFELSFSEGLKKGVVKPYASNL